MAGAEGRVPFLLVLRDFAGSLRMGGKGLAYYLEQVCRDPYNLDPPPHAIDYLLGNGRAIVLLDGLDELMEPALRRRFVQLVDGFATRYPLVPVLVTARRIGYSDAPLDHRLFSVGGIADLAEAQVRRYAERWFALDDSLVEGERARMAESFLAESKGIAELRANPLLLALLCALYSSEHYIPRNLAQVYERCALMLFDRWDSIRGIAMPVQFQGRLRGAVQYLAWQMFDADESGKALLRHRIVQMLGSYLKARGFDEDEAVAVAEQFVEFCTGRAWILTDVGATDTEQRYGFTHRTFMEYFAAEHLVRTHPSPLRLWEALGPHVLLREWEVIAQIALQLLDRNIDGGLDELLRLALVAVSEDLDQRLRRYGFVARTLRYMHPGQDVIREAVTAIVDAALEVGMRDRHRYWVSDHANVALRDDPLLTVMYRCSPGNLPIVRRTVVEVLTERIESGVETALYAIGAYFDGHAPNDEGALQAWQVVRQDLSNRYADALAAWGESAPWIGIRQWGELHRVIIRFGPWPLYLRQVFVGGSRGSVADVLLAAGPNIDAMPLDLAKLSKALLAAGRPWIADMHWWSELAQMPRELQQMTTIAEDPLQILSAPVVLLFMPYLEVYAHERFTAPLPSTAPPLLEELVIARKCGEMSSDLADLLQGYRFPGEVYEFLVSWVCRDFDVLVAPPPY